MKKEKLLILDGHSLMYRAFFALPKFTTSEGMHTNAIFGFVKMLLKMKEELKPDYIVTTFDRKAPTFRHKEYEEYKAGREKMPSELKNQFPILKELLEMLAINIFEVDGFEADDLIGTLSSFADDKGIEVYIVTGDRDALQLATDNVKVVINKKGMSDKEIYDRNRMIEEFGVTPTQFIDVKGLMGDKSDNIPGVPGIGKTIAYKLIKEYGSIERLLENIESVSGKKVKESLIENSEQAIFSKRLATIMTDVPIEINLDDIKSKEAYNVKGVKELFRKLEFKSLINIFSEEENDFNEEENDQVILENFNYEIIDSIVKLNELLEEITDTVYIQFEFLNQALFSKIEINKLYLRWEENVYCIDVNKISEDSKEELLSSIKKFFEDEKIEKICHDSKLGYVFLNKYKILFNKLSFDTKIAAYLIQPSSKDYILKEMVEERLKLTIRGESDEVKARETYFIKELYILLKEEIDKFNMEKLFYEVEMPLIEVLGFMEAKGFKVDGEKLVEIGRKFKITIESLEREIYTLADEEFNIKSPKQLGKILFEKLDLPTVKKTKTGYSTNAEVLDKLKDKHSIIEKILEYRQITKLDSTYVEGLKAVIDKDGKIHTSFNQTVTTTGRLSSTEPNLQNIPIKHEMGREIRKVFVPNNEDCIILSADYSQIELRVLAHIANDENMIDAFKNNHDIHTRTASEVFKVPIDEVTSTMRSNAKAVNFGIVYGIGSFSLSEDIKVSRKEAQQYIDAYFERFPSVKKYIDGIIKQAEEDGYVRTILNRRRFVPEAQSKNKVIKALGERLAMNTPIQGTAADIIKMAMVTVYRRLKEEKLKSSLILQVHDELILNVYKDEIEVIKKIVVDEMKKVMELSVPLEADVNIGENWYEAK